MANFKCNTVTLTELVEIGCLWVKINEDNKNKILGEESWQEVFRYVYDRYESCSR